MGELLCTDTLSHCFLFLDVQEIMLNCSLVNQHWLKCSRSNNIWNNIYNLLFMDDTFNWRSHTTNQDDEDDESSDTKKNKKQKCDESTDAYWFNLVKQYMIFPTLDKYKHELNDLSLGNMEQVYKITNVKKLHHIIDHLRSIMYNEDDNSQSFYYKCERFGPHKSNATLKENYLRLALLLTVMFGGKQNYFRDSIVISLGKYNSKKKPKRNEEQFTCPLPTFCMLVLYPDSQDSLPLDEEDDEEEMYLRAVPYLEDSNESGKDYCFFTMLTDGCGHC